MGFIIIGVVLACGFFFGSFFVKIKPDTVARVSVFIAFAGVLAGVFIPTGGYKAIEEVRTVELQPLNDPTSADNGSIFYVSATDKNEYSYYTQVESDFVTNNSKAYVSKSISRDKSTIVEEENCEIPRMTIYQKEANTTFWSYGALGTEEFYIFYIPKGSINHRIASRN